MFLSFFGHPTISFLLQRESNELMIYQLIYVYARTQTFYTAANWNRLWTVLTHNSTNSSVVQSNLIHSFIRSFIAHLCVVVCTLCASDHKNKTPTFHISFCRVRKKSIKSTIFLLIIYAVFLYTQSVCILIAILVSEQWHARPNGRCLICIQTKKHTQTYTQQMKYESIFNEIHKWNANK